MKQCVDVAAALIRKHGKLLLCQRNRGDSYALFWEFPGGTVEKKETAEEAVVREIREELGVEVAVKELFGKFSDENEDLKINISLFECFITEGALRPCDCRDFGFFSFADVKGLPLAPADKKIFAAIAGNQPG